MNEMEMIVNKEKANSFLNIFEDNIVGETVFVKKFTMDSILTESGFYQQNNYTVKHGIINEFYDSGKLKYKKSYLNNRLSGELFGFFESGEMMRHETYENDMLVSGECFTAEGKDTTFSPMIVFPKFKGGTTDQLGYFIAKNIIYPDKALAQRIEGKVHVYFYISKDGNVCDIKVAESENEIFNDEAVRIIKKSSKHWEPGCIEGKKENISFIIPINFRLRK